MWWLTIAIRYNSLTVLPKCLTYFRKYIMCILLQQCFWTSWNRQVSSGRCAQHWSGKANWTVTSVWMRRYTFRSLPGFALCTSSRNANNPGATPCHHSVSSFWTLGRTPSSMFAKIFESATSQFFFYFTQLLIEYSAMWGYPHIHANRSMKLQ